MTPIILTGAVTGSEQVDLDGLDLNDGTLLVLEAFSCPPPRKRYDWIAGTDTDGSLLARDPLFDNREITLRVRVGQQSTMDFALDRIGELVDKLEEAERQTDGLPLQWSPAGSERVVTFYVLSGEIDEMPISWNGDDTGWFVRSPVLTVKLVCKPHGYLPEVLAGTTTASTPLVTLELTGVEGDAPAEGRLVITDAASKDRRSARWGIESRHYPTVGATSLMIDSDSLNTGGFGGTDTTRTGAYDPNASGNNVIRATLATSATAVCGTGAQGHIGVFRVIARVYGTSNDVRVRMSWRVGDGVFHANPYTALPAANAFSRVDLGTITVPEAEQGTQTWEGRIEAYGAISPQDTLDVDYVALVPALEGHGLARSAYSYTAGVVNAHDPFTGIVAGTVLNARAAPTGGTWATSGAATDFTAADSPSGWETMSRTTSSDASPRFAILGSTNYTNTEVQVQVRTPAQTDPDWRPYVIGRWVDANNYLFGTYVRESSGNRRLELHQVVGSGDTLLSANISGPGYPPDAWVVLRLIAYASGKVVFQVLTYPGFVLMQQVSTISTAVATGGGLATGKPGFADRHLSVGAARYYTAFHHSVPAAEPIPLYSGQSLEVRSDTAIRENATGTTWGVPPHYRGSRFFVPCAGDESRKARVAVMAARDDVTVEADQGAADSTTVAVYVTPRVIAVGR